MGSLFRMVSTAISVGMDGKCIFVGTLFFMEAKHITFFSMVAFFLFFLMDDGKCISVGICFRIVAKHLILVLTAAVAGSAATAAATAWSCCWSWIHYGTVCC